MFVGDTVDGEEEWGGVTFDAPNGCIKRQLFTNPDFWTIHSKGRDHFHVMIELEVMSERFCPFHQLILIAIPWSFCSSHVNGNIFQLCDDTTEDTYHDDNHELTIKISTPDP